MHMKNRPLVLKELRPLSRLADGIVGLSYQSLFVLWVFLSFSIGVMYFLLSYFPGQGPGQLTQTDATIRFWNSIYFSFVTATSTGYGDITPEGLSKPLAILESILALIIFAVLVTKLISHKQDIALRQIHKLVFEDVFHNIREGFFIVRKDFDSIILTVEKGESMQSHDWENLETAYRQAQSFLRRIPDFYEPEDRLYTIDIRREELLLDGLYRTVNRTYNLLSAFQTARIQWINQNESVEELREFLQLTEVIVRLWEQHCLHDHQSQFQELLACVNTMHSLIDSEVMSLKYSS